MIQSTITLSELKRLEGFNPEEECITILSSKTGEGHFWVCGSQQGPVTTQSPIEDIITACKAGNISFSEIVDELSGDIVRVLHITPLQNINNTVVSF